jgi:hypothetical protein
MPRPSRLVRLATLLVSLLVLCAAGGRPHASAGPAPQPPPPAPAGEAPRQTQEDDYTAYELLAPESASFRILYDVTATTPGARYYFNTIRKGSEARDERVIDLATGQPLPFEVVSGAEARRDGHPTADLETSYIRVALARPVPAEGGQRLRIDKTYRDPASYFREGETIVFARSLGIARNKVILPAGYALVSCNMPSQIFTGTDGRVAVSFMNLNPDAVGLVVKARPVKWAAGTAAGLAAGGAGPDGSAAAPARETGQGGPAREPSLAASAAMAIPERAFQDREIVYFLQPPETHAFDLYHDYTESRPGVDRYLNVVRAGSRVSNPSARVLDTGEALPVEILRGEAIRRAGLDIGEAVTPASEVVVVRFPAVQEGRSIRLRIAETYTDPGRYGLVGETLVWRRTFGRPRNAVVLPRGYAVTASLVPARVSELPDGRIRLDVDNPRPDSLDVLIRARRVDPGGGR